MIQPKYLPCLHTFCQTCITAYCVAHKFPQSLNRTLECPVCRQKITLLGEKEASSSEDWAHSLPLNFLIVELLERAKLEKENKTCASCERLGEQNEPRNFCVECCELLCDVCTKYHQAQKSLMVHTIRLVNELSKDDIKCYEQSCPLHAGEVLKLYCCDHDAVCCSICVSVDHRKCDTVKTLENVSKDIRESKMVISVRTDLINSHSALQTLKTRYSNDEKHFQEKITANIEDIKIAQTEIKQKVDEISDKLIATLMQLSENCDEKYRRKVAEVDDRILAVNNNLSMLNIALEKASNVQIRIKIDEIKKHSLEHNKYAGEQNQECIHAHLTSNIKKERRNILESLDKMFVSSLFDSCVFPFSCNSLPSCNLLQIGEKSLGTKQHEACFSSTENIFVSSFLDNRVDVYNLTDLTSPFKTIQLDYAPYNMASDKHSHIALLNQDDGIVELLNETTFSMDHKYSVSKESNGVALTLENLAVCTLNTIECYERGKGTLLRQLTDFNDISWYIHLNHNGLYFSCGDIIYCHRLLENDTFRFTCEHLTDVQGIEVDVEGNIYAADGESCEIIQITRDGTDSKILESTDDYINQPRSINFSVDRKYLLVTCNQGESLQIFSVDWTEDTTEQSKSQN